MTGSGARIQGARTGTIRHARRHRSGLLQPLPTRQGSSHLQTPGPRSEPAPPQIDFRVGTAPSIFRHLVRCAYTIFYYLYKGGEIQEFVTIKFSPALANSCQHTIGVSRAAAAPACARCRPERRTSGLAPYAS